MSASLASLGMAHGRGLPENVGDLFAVCRYIKLLLFPFIVSPNRSSPVSENAWWNTSKVLPRDFQ